MSVPVCKGQVVCVGTHTTAVNRSLCAYVDGISKLNMDYFRNRDGVSTYPPLRSADVAFAVRGFEKEASLVELEDVAGGCGGKWGGAVGDADQD